MPPSFFFLFLLLNSCRGVFNPVDNYRIACGSTQKITYHGQDYLPDSSFTLDTSGDTTHSASAATVASFPSPIYQSLRSFSSPATYRFQIRQPGRHFLRLYFSPLPAAASSLNLAAAPITAIADGFVLLENFLVRDNHESPSFAAKEFLLNLASPQLSLSFVPSNGTLSFINAIELISAPADLLPDEAAAPGGGGAISDVSRLALETVVRLNVGGPLITPENDTLSRIWLPDKPYLHVSRSAVSVSGDPAAVRYPDGGPTPETAPVWVYATADAMTDANVTGSIFNITWVFPVNPNFSYWVRLHFCDIVSKAMNTLVFNVYLGSELAIPSLDLSALKGALAVPYYRDFISNATAGNGSEITVSVGPDPLADNSNAILNGLEIFKLSNAANSLAGGLSAAELLPTRRQNSRRRAVMIAALCPSTVVLLLAAICMYVKCRRRRRRNQQVAAQHRWLPLSLYSGLHSSFASKASSRKTTGSVASKATTAAGRTFSFEEMEIATSRWDENALLGVGGFGRVYRGTLEDGSKVAIKRGNPRSEQGLTEFQTEIRMLSRLRHRHLVSLIGYCDDNSEMILVYEYMANGPLRSHLYGGGRPSLPWRRRLEICIGAARGLHYLHTGASQSVIHRDVKTTNILLDEDLVAKVADFGLSKAGPDIDQTHVSTAVKGSFGYLDPEYFRRQQLTDKSDVYSLGVVLVEVLCARPALDPALPRDQVNLAEWAMTWQRRGRLADIVDPAITAEVNAASLRKFGETAEKCLAEHAVDRPSMGDVLWNLEYALQLQEAAVAAANDEEDDDSSTNHIAGLILDAPRDSPPPAAAAAASAAGEVDDPATTSAVFSQLVNPRGR